MLTQLPLSFILNINIFFIFFSQAQQEDHGVVRFGYVIDIDNEEEDEEGEEDVEVFVQRYGFADTEDEGVYTDDWCSDEEVEEEDNEEEDEDTDEMGVYIQHLLECLQLIPNEPIEIEQWD